VAVATRLQTDSLLMNWCLLFKQAFFARPAFMRDSNMASLTNEQVLLAATMKSAFQLGVFSRASRLLMRCDEFDGFWPCVQETLKEVGLSGSIKFHCGDLVRYGTFGCGISPTVLHSLRCMDRCQAKICSNNEFLIYNSDHVLLIVDTKGSDAADLDLMIDNLTIYMDTIQNWLDHHERLCTEREEIRKERIKVSINLDSFIQCITRLSEHLIHTQQAVNEELISQLIAVFPVLGMEADQEEVILNIVNDARAKERALLDQQLCQNNELRTVMKQAIDALTADNLRVASRSQMLSESVGVTLF
jgi:phosphotransferase system IIB component